MSGVGFIADKLRSQHQSHPLLPDILPLVNDAKSLRREIVCQILVHLFWGEPRGKLVAITGHGIVSKCARTGGPLAAIVMNGEGLCHSRDASMLQLAGND